jgi:hypothetical protein
MAFRQKPDGGKRAVAWLATCFVALGGAIACTAIATGGDPEHLEATLVPVGGVVVGMIVLLLFLRDRPPETRLWTNWNWLLRRGKRRIAYRLRPKLPPCDRVPDAPAPPTAESIRNIAGGPNTWVPASTPPRRPRRSDG